MHDLRCLTGDAGRDFVDDQFLFDADTVAGADDAVIFGNMVEGNAFSRQITEIVDFAQGLLGAVAACDLDASCRVLRIPVTGTFRTPSDNLPGCVVGHEY